LTPGLSASDGLAMRVLFSSTRGAGHIQPLLPYARALRRRGHEVLVAGPADLGATLREAELPHAPFDHPGDEALGPIWARLRGVSSDQANAIAGREIFAGVNARAALPKLRQTIGDWRPHLVVRDSVEFAASAAADAAGVPHARVAVHLESFEDAMLAVVVEPVDTLRRLAGLPADEGASLRAEPVFTAFPAALDDPTHAPPARAPFRVRVPTEAPSAAIPAWAPADDPRPLLYITFGTIAGSSPHVRSIYRTSLDAVAELPVRALLTTGRGMAPDLLGPIPANVHVEAWVPQHEVLPRVAAILCHGGSGTALGALAAGLPLVVVPMFADQPLNGQRIAAVGAGLTLPDPDAGALRAAIERVLADLDHRRIARRIAEEIASLPTADDAVDAMMAIAVR
jgi:UDP:flavonoid glycosyltransferase YjiC (YdhE family)